MDSKEGGEGQRLQIAIAALALLGIGTHVILRFLGDVSTEIRDIPLIVTLVLGGLPLSWELLVSVYRREFGADLLAGVSIVTSILLGEYLAGSVVVLMLSGGNVLEVFAVRNASAVLSALAKRMPSVAHRRLASGTKDVAVEDVAIGDVLEVRPHEVFPVDGEVTEGRGTVDESYLTGEPYLVSKTPGSAVLSGSINGESALVIRATKLAVDSRYAQIMQVMEASQQQRPRIRRLGDRLGALYTPIILAVAISAWLASGDALRFLAVLVVATPCPLLIGIPVAIIGSISLAARRAIVVRDPSILETISTCSTVAFDKTGTLTYGEPHLTEALHRVDDEGSTDELLAMAGSLERYSRHPLAAALRHAFKERELEEYPVTEIRETPGQGLRGTVDDHRLWITSRKQLLAANPSFGELLPEEEAGLECVLVVDDEYRATYRFRDTPRTDGHPFVQHLGERHGVDRVMLISGDRLSEVRYLAECVGVEDVRSEKSPEEKVEIVREETQRAPTIFVGDGVNDAPALSVATVGIAFGQNSDVTTEAAGAVILDSSLRKLDELLHIGARTRHIALETAVGGMALSMIAVVVAALGYLPPVAGAVTQEVIDVFAVVNAMRAAMPPRSLTDY